MGDSKKACNPRRAARKLGLLLVTSGMVHLPWFALSGLIVRTGVYLLPAIRTCRPKCVPSRFHSSFPVRGDFSRNGEEFIRAVRVNSRPMI